MEAEMNKSMRRKIRDPMDKGEHKSKTQYRPKVMHDTKQAKPHSATRKNNPQNSKIFKSEPLPHGGTINYFSVPGKDAGDRPGNLFTESRDMDFASTTKTTFGSSSKGSPERGLTNRYASTQQPWAMATLGNREYGIIPDKYEAKVKQHLEAVRRARTAPSQMDRTDSAKPMTSSEMDELLMTLTSDPAASEIASSWIVSASRLERAVIQQFLRDVAPAIHQSRGSRPTSRSTLRPPTSGSARPTSRLDSRGGRRPVSRS